MNSYDQGDRVRLTATFRSYGVAVDPSALTFRIVGPSTDTTYTYPTDAQLVKDSVGNYHVDFTIPATGKTAAGRYAYRFTGTGANNPGAAEGVFVVPNSRVLG